LVADIAGPAAIVVVQHPRAIAVMIRVIGPVEAGPEVTRLGPHADVDVPAVLLDTDGAVAVLLGDLGGVPQGEIEGPLPLALQHVLSLAAGDRDGEARAFVENLVAAVGKLGIGIAVAA